VMGNFTLPEQWWTVSVTYKTQFQPPANQVLLPAAGMSAPLSLIAAGQYDPATAGYRRCDTHHPCSF
jgi:hypothetical protein